MAMFECCTKDGCGKVVNKDEEAKQKAAEEAEAQAKAEEQAKREREMREIEATRLQIQQAQQAAAVVEQKTQEAPKAAPPPPEPAPEPVSPAPEQLAAKERPQPGAIVAKTETSVDFMAKLEKKANQQLGLELKREKNGDQLVIRSSTGIALEKWNEGNPQFQIVRADQIVAVNGTTGKADDLIEAIKNSGDEIEMQLHRELRVSVTLDKTAQLGIKLSPQTATIAGVFDGIILAWNREHKPSMEVGMGDKLTEVNGSTGSATELQQAVAAISNGQSMTLVFERPTVG